MYLFYNGECIYKPTGIHHVLLCILSLYTLDLYCGVIILYQNNNIVSQNISIIILVYCLGKSYFIYDSCKGVHPLYCAVEHDDAIETNSNKL